MLIVARCFKEQSVPGSKMCLGTNCFKKHSVLRSKMFQGAKYESAKCSVEQSVCQPPYFSAVLNMVALP